MNERHSIIVDQLHTHAGKLQELLEELLPLIDEVDHAHSKRLISAAAEAELLTVIRLRIAANSVEKYRGDSR